MSTPFVGREAEIRQLSGLLRETIGGTSRVMFISGGAGAGKSSLVEAFIARAEEEHEDVAIAIGACDAQTGIGDPYLPFLEVLQQLSGIVDGRVAQGKLTQARSRKFAHTSIQVLLEYAPDLLGTVIPGSSLLIGVAKTVAEKAGWTDKLKARFEATEQGTTSVDQQRIMESYTALIRQLSARVPLVLVLDDLHWVDAASCALLFHLAQNLRDARVLIIGTFRANDVAFGRGGDRHPLTPVLNELKRYHGDIVLDLDAAGEAQRREFVSAIVDSEPNDLDDAFRAALFQHTGGHALFTVELLCALKERGCIVHGKDGALHATVALDWSVLPSRVEGVIEERIGRLEEELRELLSVASVEGQSFTVEILSRLNEISERALLKTLSGELEKRHQLISEGEVEKIGPKWISHYNFAHALFQQYLYNHLGRRQKMMLHGSVATILEELYAGHLDLVTPQLAHHYGIAGEAQKAFEYSMRAARRAVRMGACAEVLAQTSAALGFISELPPAEQAAAEVDAQLLRGHAFQVLQGWDGADTTTAYSRVAELAAKLPPDSRTTNILTTAMIFGLLAQKIMRLELAEAEALASDLLASAERLNLHDARIQAHEALCMAYYHQGKFALTIEQSKKVVDLVDPTDVARYVEEEGTDPRALPLYARVISDLVMGDLAAAAEDQKLLESVIRATEHPYSIAIAQSISYTSAFVNGDAALTLSEGRRALDLLGGTDSAFYRAMPQLYMAWAEAKLGDPEGPAKITEAFRRMNANGGLLLQSVYAMMMADAYAARGQFREALEAIDAGIACSDAHGEYICISEVHRTRGEILRAAGRPAEAREAYEAALAHARRQGARFYEQRAAAALTALDAAMPGMPINA